MATKPNLALIPSAYKASKVYSILPNNGDGDFTFSRGSEATRINKDGLIETVLDNIPRLDYSDGGCPSLLLEPQRTNLFENSSRVNEANTDDFAIGTGQTPTVLSENNLAPDGSLTACEWNFNVGSGVTTNDASLISKSYATTSGLDYTMSVHIYAELDNTKIYIRAAGSIYSLRTLNAGWNKVEVTDTATSTSSSWLIGLRQAFSGGIINSNITIKIWGLQVEQGSYVTSYIPTSGGPATRVVDSASKTGLNSYINSEEGVLYFETKGFIDLPIFSRYIQLSKNGETGFNNSLVIQHRDNGALRVYANGTATSDIHFNIDIDFTQNHKIAVLYKLNGYKLFIDGVAQSLFGTPTQAVFSGLDDLSFDLRGSSNWNAKIKDLRYYNTELTDAELTELTTL